MKLRVKVIQVLRIEKSAVIEVDADDMADAIEAIESGAIDLPSASDDPGNIWCIDHNTLENEEYRPAE